MLRRFKAWRRRTQLVVVLAAALVFAGSALAAWVIFTGGQGAVQGSFGSATTSPALTITDLGSGSPISCPGCTGTVKLLVNNVNPNNVSETITGETDTFTSTPSDCASHLSVQGNAPLAGTVVPPNGSTPTEIITVAADSTIPGDCPNGSYTLHISLTSNP